MPHIIKGQGAWEIMEKKHKASASNNQQKWYSTAFPMVFLNRIPKQLCTWHNQQTLNTVLQFQQPACRLMLPCDQYDRVQGNKNSDFHMPSALQ